MVFFMAGYHQPGCIYIYVFLMVAAATMMVGKRNIVMYSHGSIWLSPHVEIINTYWDTVQTCHLWFPSLLYVMILYLWSRSQPLTKFEVCQTCKLKSLLPEKRKSLCKWRTQKRLFRKVALLYIIWWDQFRICHMVMWLCTIQTRSIQFCSVQCWGGLITVHTRRPHP